MIDNVFEAYLKPTEDFSIFSQSGYAKQSNSGDEPIMAIFILLPSSLNIVSCSLKMGILGFSASNS